MGKNTLIQLIKTNITHLQYILSLLEERKYFDTGDLKFLSEKQLEKKDVNYTHDHQTYIQVSERCWMKRKEK